MFEGFTYLPGLMWNIFQILILVILIILASFAVKSISRMKKQSKGKERSYYDLVMTGCLVIPLILGLIDFINQKPIPQMAKEYFGTILPLFITIIVLASLLEVAIPTIEDSLEEGEQDEE